MTQAQAVLQALEKLGGIATLAQIYQHTLAVENCQWGTKTPQATIRRLVRHTRGIFNVRKGLYALEDIRASLQAQGALPSASGAETETSLLFNHTYYQGLLTEICNFKGLNSFVPSQDKNRLFYDGRHLGEMATLPALPDYTYPELVHRSSTIDSVWMNERRMPHSFFEVEHTTDIQNSLLKYVDLQDFNVNMYIVADSRRKAEFEHKLCYYAFRELCAGKRVKFLSFDNLVTLYEQEMARADMEVVI